VAAHRPDRIAGVIARGGRCDLAGVETLARVMAPTLLIVGAEDHGVLELNRAAQRAMQCQVQLLEVPGATHLFQESGTLDEVARLAGDWLDALPTAQQPLPA
jgi:pimeloyl-ACP methyl ester carboxylesterase